ncbi:MAG: precorrin-3B C(17)-methyltransferase [Deltaproteobacteria bacterium]|jgi:precorrin-3B C17-methyltransferase|nr:precorrin-3B C(17)-methyltransferase [Deltaproteobacteria bacterium]
MLYIISLGPGRLEHMTLRGHEALKASDVIVGYGTYLDLIQPLLAGKEVFSTGMKKEIERCEKAIESAMQGRTVAVVSSGDAGIYGMAGLILELCARRGIKPRLVTRAAGQTTSHCAEDESECPPTIAIEVIPGVPALAAGAALLGAPLMHDFAVISMSDLLTPWETIETRVKAAAEADFVVVIYNPKSRGRDWQLGRAQEILLRHRPANTPVGIVKKAMREGEDVTLTTLQHMTECHIDMQTIIFVGNSSSFTFWNLLVTPRGYRKKYDTD